MATFERVQSPGKTPLRKTKRKRSDASPSKSPSIFKDYISDTCTSEVSDDDTQAVPVTNSEISMPRTGSGPASGGHAGLGEDSAESKRSSRQHAGPGPSKAAYTYDIIFTLPDTDLHKTVAINAEDSVRSLFCKVEEKLGQLLYVGDWQLELRFPDLPNKDKGGYLIDRADCDTWRTFNGIVKEGVEKEVQGVFYLQK